MRAIGIIESAYKEKFGIPRQPGLAKSSRAVIRIKDPKNEYLHAFDGLEKFSHLWVIFLFHELGQTAWKARIRPPRLGGAKKLGVYATRSPHRPNPIGLSAVELEKIEKRPHEILIHARGGDFLDGTPVLDIKPYLPYADSIPRAKAGWTSGAELKKNLLPVSFSREALKVCNQTNGLKKLITETLRLDPRPAFQTKNPAKSSYAVWLESFDVHWSIEGKRVRVEKVLLRIEESE